MKRRKRMPDIGYTPKKETNILYDHFYDELNLLFNEEHHKYIKHGEDCLWYIANRWNPEANTEYGPLEKSFFKKLKTQRPEGTKRTILVYGGTGHGKSCFVEHFFQSYLPRFQKEFDNKIVYLRINISSQPNEKDLEEDTDHQVNDKLNQLFPELKQREHYFKVWETVYNIDNDFHQDVLNDYPFEDNEKIRRKWIDTRMTSPGRTSNTRWADFNRARINYLIETMKLQIILFFDNVDQAKRTVQEDVFRLARHKLEWINDTKYCTIVMAVRDYMITKAKTELPIASFNTEIFRIYPPDIDKIIERRIYLAVQRSKNKFHQATIALPTGINITIKDLDGFLKHIVRSVTHTEARYLLYEITENNVRVQLDIIHRALKNPDISIKDALEYIRTFKEKITHEMLLDPAELINHIMSPNSTFEHSQENPLINAFNAGDRKHQSNTFTIYNILCLFQDREGWNVKNLKKELFKTGCTDYILEVALQTLLDSRLIFSKEGLNLIEDNLRNIKISYAGDAFLDKFMFKLFYMEIMGYATPLENEIYRKLPKQPKYLMQRLKGVPALYHQIKRDEEYEEKKLEKNEFASFQTEYNITPLSDKIRKKALTEIIKIKTLNEREIKQFKGWFDSLDAM